MGEIAQLIQDVGFPVGVCIVCFYFIYKLVQETREDNIKREELLFTRIGEISKTLAHVSQTLLLIDERIEKLEKGDGKKDE